MYTIGADPEVMVRKNGALTSAWNLIKGTKDAPLPVKDGAVQVDGCALEFNILPATNSEEFVHNINSVLTELQSMVPQYELAFDEPVLHLTGEEDPESLIIGCDPDFSAYFGKNEHRLGNFRAAGGHIHLGWDGTRDEGEIQKLVRLLDLRVGIPLALERTSLRNQSYGRLGNYRLKPYGVEYRSPDNFWVSSPSLQEWVFDTCQQVLIDFFENGVRVTDEQMGILYPLAYKWDSEQARKLL